LGPRIGTALGFAAAYAPGAWACSVCFGDPQAPQTQGMNAAIATLLVVTAVVVGSLLTGAWRMARRIERAGAEAVPPAAAEGQAP